ncbi:collagen alpha-1(XXV) chain-like isoform X2 [Entelurus aequoreus]|uniref:collagen alpha-1(XXV) chain-like isoform X2 n=1 Tax=Entelurus aequoreus TaxID=161455 RepID=UPI002B1E2F3D|nr:collagen alpha-1(XXV) chain-like isoform X2 [Entelurus aequoreus]
MKPAAAGSMDTNVDPRKKSRASGVALSAIPSVCSVASVAFCIVLSIHAADVRRRLVGLEHGADTFTRTSAGLDALIEQKVNQMFTQRSYEQFVKTRTARQASPECNCPPVCARAKVRPQPPREPN